jgi:L-lactate dehydrogenase complex protein LldG
VVLASGADNPVTLNYLADYHIVVVERSRVVAYQEEVWAMHREHGMPRALCYISGPSRTGDIEFDIQLGAHGPRNLHVIVVGSE